MRERETGQRKLGSDPLAAAARQLRAASLDLSTHFEFATVHNQAVTALSLEGVEGRYLLSAAFDATMGLFDVLDVPCEPTASAEPLQPLATIHRTNPDAHKFAVSTLAWFPHDTGAFVTGGYDEQVKLWDTNEMRPVCDFTLPGRVECVAMSSVASTHALIAAAGAGHDIRLVDPATCTAPLEPTAPCVRTWRPRAPCEPAARGLSRGRGSATHTLSGHRAPAWVVCWSPRDEHRLVSGGADGCVRVWDLRRPSGWFSALDLQDTAAARQLAPSRDTPPAAGGEAAGSGEAAGGSRSGGRGGRGRGSHGGGGSVMGVRQASRGGYHSTTTVAGRAAALAGKVAHQGAVSCPSMCILACAP